MKTSAAATRPKSSGSSSRARIAVDSSTAIWPPTYELYAHAVPLSVRVAMLAGRASATAPSLRDPPSEPRQHADAVARVQRREGQRHPRRVPQIPPGGASGGCRSGGRVGETEPGDAAARMGGQRREHGQRGGDRHCGRRNEVVWPEEVRVLLEHARPRLTVVAVLPIGGAPRPPRHVAEADGRVEEDGVARAAQAPVELLVLAVLHRRVETPDLDQRRAPVHAALHAVDARALGCAGVLAPADAEARCPRSRNSLREAGLALLLRPPAHAGDG